MVPPIKHIHADLILEKARQDATGETAAKWWRWEFYTPSNGWADLPGPLFLSDSAYRYSRAPAHPLFVPPKPELKLVDMMALPVGSWVTCAYLETEPAQVMVVGPVALVCWNKHELTVSVSSFEARITEQKEFTYWGGGACPVPDGLKFEFVWRDGGKSESIVPTKLRWIHTLASADVIAYRILGLADGWTDDPTQTKENHAPAN